MTEMKLSMVLILVLIFLLLAVYLYLKGRKEIAQEEEITSFEDALEALKLYCAALVVDPDDVTGTDEEYERRKKKRRKTAEALKNSVYGIPAAVVYVKEIIREFVTENIPQNRVDQILGLDENSVPSPHIMFEIIMHEYRKEHFGYALAEWIYDNDLNRPKPAKGVTSQGDTAYYITTQELEDCYLRADYHLTPEERVDILVTWLFEAYKGFGILTTINEMKINGYNIGVSGSVMEAVGEKAEKEEALSETVTKATNSLWLYLGEQYIHLQFLDFGTTDEIRRIIQLLIRYNSPGPLTAKRGFIINTLYDQSRIMAMRPPVGECWSAFIRKNPIAKIDPTSLIIKNYTKNGEIIVKLLQYLMGGDVTLGVTGRQGSGKTTLMIGLVTYYDPKANIRVLEMAPEMYLRERYPNRNIFSAQETQYVSAEAIQDTMKKSDSYYTIIGEVATNEVAARMIQLKMTGSVATMFSHHANTAEDLVLTLRNSLTSAGNFNNTEIAEKQVTEGGMINVHMNYRGNKRYIERITEIIPGDEGVPYPEFDKNEPDESLANINREYYRRRTDRLNFTTEDIMVYDTVTDTYICKSDFSEKMKKKIYTALPVERKQEFLNFMDHYWHGKEIEGYAGVTDIKNEIEEAMDYGMLDIDAAAAFLSRRPMDGSVVEGNIVDQPVTPYGFGTIEP